ncbi:MAG: hypothetical protein ACLGIF_01355 [Actinomycetes bacterium]
MAPSSEGAPTDGEDQVGSADRAEVNRELSKIREFAQSLRLDEVREGTWFSRLLRYSLDSYVREVDAGYLQRKYPGLPPDATVEARIQLAARYASIEGGLSAGAYTGAVAATIGSAGGASPLTLPAAGASFVVDLLFVSHLQLRLAYDIAVLYRVPLDLEDPEDLWKLIRTAFAIKSGEAGREVVGKGAPIVLRPILKKLYGGSTLAAARSLPVIGRYLLKRNVLKFSIPAVGVPLSMAINHWSTRTAGLQARKVFRAEARIVEAARRMTDRTAHRTELLWVLWLVIKADGLIHENERALLKYVTEILRDVESEMAALTELEATVDLEHKRVWSLLAAAEGDLAPLYEAGVVAAAVDGKINVNELTALRRLAEYCGTHVDEQAVRALAGGYAKGE